MRDAIDVVIGEAVNAVQRSGLATSNARMAIVSAVATDGTLSIDDDEGPITGVRMLSGYPTPAVGTLVELLNTVGGWVCLGAIVSTTPTTMPWTALNALGSYATGYSNGSPTPRMRKYISAGTETWEFEGQVSLPGLGGTNTQQIIFFNFTPTHRVGVRRVLFGGSSGANNAPCRLTFDPGGELRIGFPSYTTNATVAYLDGLRITNPLRT